jgi:hypothetical protein
LSTLSPHALAADALRLQAEGRLEAALNTFDQAVALDPADPALRHDRSYLRLAMGDFPGGWADYETRFAVPTDTPLLHPRVLRRLDRDVTRASLKGADVMVVFEQGIGDQIMFASMLPDLAADARDVVCLCEPRLASLLSRSLPTMQFGSSATDTGRRVLALGSLGRLYRNRLEDFPGTPYLAAGAELRARWAGRLGPRPARLRIGLSWRGGSALTRSHSRSLPVEALRSLLDLPGCDYVSLQYGDPRAEVAALNATLKTPIRVFDPQEIDDFESLAALVDNLDVVVSVQTAIVHLAGAVGRRCLTLLPYRAEWRYGASGPTMPWYRSVELLRQSTAGDWGPVIDAAKAALTA